MSLLKLLFVLGFAILSIGAEEIELVGSSHVFGGETNLLQIRVTNHSTNELKANLSFQVFQISDKLIASVNVPEEWREVTIPPTSSRTYPLSLRLPEVRLTTRFMITWSSSSSHPHGSVLLTVHPRTLLNDLREQLSAGRVALWDPEERLHKTFAALGLRAHEIASESQLQFFDGDLLIFARRIAKESDFRRRLAQFRQLNQRNIAVVFCYENERNWLREPLLLYEYNGKQRNTVLAPLESVAGIHAEQQAELARMITCATHNNPLTLLAYDEH